MARRRNKNDDFLVMNTANGYLKRVSIKTFEEMKTLNTWKKLYTSKYEKWVFLSSLPIIDYLTIYQLDRRFDMPIWGYLLAPVGYFLGKSVFKVTKENMTGIKYIKISKMFDNKVKVISVDKENGLYVLNSYIPYTQIESKKGELEHFFNREIKSITRNKRNFKHITISLMNDNDSVKLKKIYRISDYIKTVKVKGKIPFLLGVNKAGRIILGDLKKIHHFMISGGSGGGKTTLENSIIQSLMYFNNNIAYIFIDFKRVGLNVYKQFDNSIFIKEHEDSLVMLEKIYKEMMDRYDKFEELEIEDIDQYNKVAKTKMPIIVLVIDEIASIKLRGSSEVKDKIENILTEILNMGRASGIHMIAATQRPGGKQISTEVRAGLLGKVSTNIQEIETQKMAGVKGTENLNQGEFKTVNMGLNGDVLKGFYVDRTDEWLVYNELKSVLTNESVDFSQFIKKEKIKIKKSNVKIDNFKKYINKYIKYYDDLMAEIHKKFPKKKNKSVEQVLEHNKICSSQKSVIELISYLKNAENDSFCSSVPVKEDKLYIKLVKFLEDNRKGEKLPVGPLVEKEFNIKKRERLDLYKKAEKEGVLILKPGNVYIYNVNKQLDRKEKELIDC